MLAGLASGRLLRSFRLWSAVPVKQRTAYNIADIHRCTSVILKSRQDRDHKAPDGTTAERSEVHAKGPGGDDSQ